MSKHRVKICLTASLIFAFCLLMIACSPRVNTSDSDDAGAGEVIEVGDFIWSTEKDCSMCHERSAASLAMLSCEAAQGDPNTTCITCHADAEGVAAAHDGVTLSDTAGDSRGLKKSEVPQNACLTCHDQGDLIVAAADVTDLTDANGFTANPHAVTTQYNVDGAHNAATCTSCHNMHSEDATAKTAGTYCRNCHHKDVYECYTCHP